MLKKISIYNSSGISKKVEMDFTKSNYSFRDQYIKNEIVSPIVFYGTNASGKTSILKTIRNISTIMNEDLILDTRYVMKNIDLVEELTIINMEIEIENIKYTYDLEIDKNSTIVEEKVTYKNIIIKRSDYLESPSKLSVIRAIGSQDKDKEITKLYKFFRKIIYVGTDRFVYRPTSTKSFSDLMVENNHKFANLDKFDTIMNLQFEKESGLIEDKLVAIYKGKKFDYEHMLSMGTRDFYEMMSVVFELEPGSLLVIDEVEKTFHPDLLRQVIDYIVKNFDIQLIVSSHNTNFMKYLRPDQIFFTKKDIDDRVSVEKLSTEHPNIREIHNIEKLYLGGKFGKW